MARPRVQSPKSFKWLWDKYEAHKEEIKQLKKDKEKYRRLAQKFGEALRVIRHDVRSTIEEADPYTAHWKED